MCNCGNKRATFSEPSNPNAAIGLPSPPASAIHVSFQCTGNTASNVKGASTGRNYRFYRPVDIQAIDHRDSRFMMAINVLRKVG